MPRRILIIEDDSDLVACLLAVLEGEYVISAARDGATGLALCQSESPSLVLVDLHLPGEPTGAALVSALRRVVPRDCRLVLLSAERDLPRRARELGADGSLEKPFDVDELLRLLDKHFGGHRPGAEPRA